MSHTTYESVTVATKLVNGNTVVDISCGVGVSVDLEMEQFGMGPCTLEQPPSHAGGIVMTFKRNVELDVIAEALEVYFRKLKEAMAAKEEGVFA